MPLRRMLYMVRDTDWPLSRAQELFWHSVAQSPPEPAPDQLPIEPNHPVAIEMT
jgi:hypothetical protein